MALRLRLKKKIVFAAIAAAAVLFALEVSFRFLPGSDSQRISDSERINYDGLALTADPELLFRMAPGVQVFHARTYQHNRYGWRGDPVEPKKESGDYRAMYFGDSSVWGHDVDRADSFPYLAGYLLEQEYGINHVDTVNTATPGYSSTQCRILLDKYGPRFRPHTIVIASLWSDIMVMPFTDEQAFRRIAVSGYPYESRLRLLGRISALFRRLEILVENLRGTPQSHRLALSSIFTAVEPESGGKARVAVKQHYENLVAMVKKARSIGADVYLVMLACDPKQFNWNSDRLRDYQRNFYRVAEELNVPLVDVEKIYRQREEPLEFFFSDGLHPNTLGHRLIAEKLAETIGKRLPEN